MCERGGGTLHVFPSRQRPDATPSPTLSHEGGERGAPGVAPVAAFGRGNAGRRGRGGGRGAARAAKKNDTRAAGDCPALRNRRPSIQGVTVSLASFRVLIYPSPMTRILPAVRGTLTPGRPLADLTWLRVGGPADWLFQPADEADLAAFLARLDPAVPVFPMGVGSNLIVRDGGIRGVVVRLGRGFNGIAVEGNRVTAGAAALDAHVARKAAEAGVDLTYLRTIPGAVGGAVRMNAGCYGSYTADHLVTARVVLRDGTVRSLGPREMGFAYRSSLLPEGAVIVEATFEGPKGDPAALEAKMAEQLARRDATQPVKDRTAGSTFRNPGGFSSTGRADDVHDLKAWKLIDDAGLRGFRRGGAVMSEKHPNFLTNIGGATAAELEELGEEVRKRVFESSGLTLEWEIMRVGEKAPVAGAQA